MNKTDLLMIALITMTVMYSALLLCVNRSWYRAMKQLNDDWYEMLTKTSEVYYNEITKIVGKKPDDNKKEVDDGK